MIEVTNQNTTKKIDEENKKVYYLLRIENGRFKVMEVFDKNGVKTEGAELWNASVKDVINGLTKDEAAEYLSISLEELEHLTTAKVLNMQIGGIIQRYSKADLDAFKNRKNKMVA
jgi:hypothetical protein